MILNDNFCRKLREALRARGRSQEWLAEATGIHPPNISKYMNGKIQPGVDKVEAFATALGVAPWNLLDDQPLKYLPLPTAPQAAEPVKRRKAAAPAPKTAEGTRARASAAR